MDCPDAEGIDGPRGVRPWQAWRVKRPVLLVLVAATTIAACRGVPEEPGTPSPTVPSVNIGTWEGVEPELIAAVTAGLLGEAGIPADVERFADADAARQALELERIDVLPGYTGATWLEELGLSNPPADPRESYTGVRGRDEANGIEWLRPTFGRGLGFDVPPANATFAFFVRGVPAETASIGTMSRLARRLSEEPEDRVCIDPEFAGRPDGLAAVWDVYGVPVDREVFGAAPDEAVALVAQGDCLAGLSTATDGHAWRRGLVPLIDDLQVFPAFVVVPRIREGVESEYPEFRTAVAPLLSNLTTRMLGEWNGRVLGGQPADLVAADAVRQLLRLAGRLPSPEPDGIA